jgi:hypothetical protein
LPKSKERMAKKSLPHVHFFDCGVKKKFCGVNCIMDQKNTHINNQKTLKARRYFLTIPRYEMGSEASSETRANGEGPVSVKERLRDLLKEREEYLSQYMIGEESHIDGSKHYHIYLKYSKVKEFGFSHFDYLGKHGKLEGCRNPRRAYIYMSKEDKQPLANFDYESVILAGKPEEIAMYLTQTEKTYSELFSNNASIDLLATKWRSLKTWEVEKQQEKKLLEINKRKQGIKKIDENLMREYLNLEELELMKKDRGLQIIVRHINKLIEYKWSRPFKTKNLLIWSEKPGVGKTSLVRKIMEYCPMYNMPRDQWYHGYKSGVFWGILWNETTLKGVDVEMLKNFLEGTPVSLNMKGSKVEKEDNPEVFMTANYSLQDMVEEKYRNVLDERKRRIVLNALRERIDEVNIDDYEDIFFLSKLIVPLDSVV